MKWWLLAAFGVALVLISLQPIRPDSDLDRDRSYAVTVLEGESPYDGNDPRPPSALVLQLPLAAVPEQAMDPLVRVLSAGSAVVLAWSVTRKPMWLIVGAAALAVSTPMRFAVEAGNLAPVVSALVAYSLRSDHALGAAASLRLYPAMLAPLGDWRKVAGWFVGLNLAGWALVRVSPWTVLENFATIGRQMVEHPGNMSLPAVLYRAGLPSALGYVALVGVVWGWKRRDWALTAASALLASTISWPSYQLMLVPALPWAAVLWWTPFTGWLWLVPVLVVIRTGPTRRLLDNHTPPRTRAIPNNTSSRGSNESG